MNTHSYDSTVDMARTQCHRHANEESGVTSLHEKVPHFFSLVPHGRSHMHELTACPVKV